MEPPKPAESRTVPPRRRGLVHVIDATGYSIAGLRRLWLETCHCTVINQILRIRRREWAKLGGLAVLGSVLCKENCHGCPNNCRDQL